MGKTGFKSKSKSNKIIRADQVRTSRRLAWTALCWGVIYGIVALCILFSKSFNAGITIAMFLGTVIIITPYFLFPIYLSAHYPKKKGSFAVPSVFGLLAVRFVLYALLYEFMYEGASGEIVSWKTAFWGIAFGALVVFIYIATQILKGKLHHFAVYFGVAVSALPALVLAGGFVFSAFQLSFAEAGGGVGEFIGSILLILFLVAGEILLHLAIYSFCKKAELPDLVSDNSKLNI